VWKDVREGAASGNGNDNDEKNGSIIQQVAAPSKST
jgi:hypothetical protein